MAVHFYVPNFVGILTNVSLKTLCCLLRANHFSQNITYQPTPPSLGFWLRQSASCAYMSSCCRGRCCNTDSQNNPKTEEEGQPNLYSFFLGYKATLGFIKWMWNGHMRSWGSKTRWKHCLQQLKLHVEGGHLDILRSWVQMLSMHKPLRSIQPVRIPQNYEFYSFHSSYSLFFFCKSYFSTWRITFVFQAVSKLQLQSTIHSCFFFF